MTSIHHSFHFAVQPAAIRSALTEEAHLRKWWTKHASVQNGKGVFRWPENDWSVEFTIEPPDGGREVVWSCTKSNMQNTHAWEGSQISFRLTSDATGTKVEFTQSEYQDSACLEACANDWNYFLGTSLKNYLESGKGTPYPEAHDTTKPSSSREVVTTRVFNVSREVLFTAWSDPTHLIEWWGPKGCTSTFQEFDFRARGLWHFTIQTPNGINVENKCVFVEIARPERIVFEHLQPAPKFQATWTLELHGSKTKLTFRMRFETQEECDKVKVLVSDANEQIFDRLEAEVVKMM